VVLLKGRVTRFFASGFFHESVSPQPKSIPFGPFQIFSKIRTEIRKSRCTAGINDTGGNFATSVNNTSGNFATSVNDTGGKLAPVSTTPVVNFATSFTVLLILVANLQLVSTIPAANLPPVSRTPLANNGNNIRLLRP
jgi:hypothetical protein